MEQSDEDKNATGMTTASKTGSGSGGGSGAFAANVTTARDPHASHISASQMAQLGHSTIGAAPTPRPLTMTAIEQSSLHDVIHDVIAEEQSQRTGACN